MKQPLLLTIDLEWFYVGGEKKIDQMDIKEKIAYAGNHIINSVDLILRILAEEHQHITFFTVAELDKAYPQVLQKINDAGHEIALHSYSHKDLSTAQEINDDFGKSVEFINKFQIIGYRSPRIAGREDLYLELKKHKFKYDSSVYGTSKFMKNDIEVIPVSVLPYKNKEIQNTPSVLNFNLLEQSIPFGSGIMCGIMGKKIDVMIEKFSKRYQLPPCVFMHSWQILQPKYKLKFLMRNPLMIPYAINCSKIFRYLCKKYKPLTIKDYLYG